MRHVCSQIGKWLYGHDAVHEVYIGIGDVAMRRCGRSRDLYTVHSQPSPFLLCLVYLYGHVTRGLHNGADH